MNNKNKIKICKMLTSKLQIFKSAVLKYVKKCNFFK